MVKKLLYLLALLVSTSFAQDAEIFKPDSSKREIHAVRISSSLRVDGLINEEEWKKAKPVSDFIQIEPYQGKLPNHDTEIRVLYNKHFLYFGIFARDSLGKKAIRATDFKRDFNYWQHDLLNLSFDGFNDQRNAMALVTNAYGVQRDLLSFDDLYYDVDWDGLWRVRTSRTDSGWVAEMRIPWQTLRYPKTQDSIQHWGFNLYRNRRLTNEITAFSPYPRAYSSLRMNYAGVLKNLQPPPPRPNIRMQPYLLGSYDHYRLDNPDSKDADTHFKGGGELKWAINPNTVLDLTANTDFAQADADRQVNNVTRLSVFFPERRQFFLENASLFGVGQSQSDDGSGGSMRIQPFFSRRIGLDDYGNPIPIDAGGRFVYRSLKRNFGTMVMRQREVGESPGTNFMVGRYSENFGKLNRVGALVTVKNRPDYTNIVSAADAFFRMGDAHSISTMLMHSTSSNGGKQGYAGFMQYFYTTNQFKIWLGESVVTKNFNPEMGFLSRTDVIATSPGINWYYRGSKLPFKKFIRAYEPGFTPDIYHQASTGKLVESSLFFFPMWLNFQKGGFFGYGINPTYQRLFETFTPVGIDISMGEYNYTRHQFFFRTDPSKMLNLMSDFSTGTYFNGKLMAGDFTLQFAPIPHLSIKGRFNRYHFKNVGKESITKDVDLYSIEGRFALNPRVQLISFYQKNSENSSDNYNIRLSWEYRPLSFVYIVYNHRSSFDTQLERHTIEDHVIAKVSYLHQF